MPNTNDFLMKNQKTDEKIKRRAALKKPVKFFLIIVAIIFLMSMTFKISKIEVSGNSIYSEEEIISASGIYTGDNLFFINRIAAGSRVVVKLPYVDSVAITRTLPNKVTILVQESKAIGYAEIDGEYWTISQSGKYLGKIDVKNAENLARISGLTLENPAVGSAIKAKEGEEAKLQYLQDIMYQIQTRGLIADVNSIDVGNEANPEISFQNRFTVRFGENENTEYKFGKMLTAISQLGEDDAGVMDLSTADKVYFNPN